jgi:hypothetical protein
MALEGGDVLKTLVVVSPSEASDEHYCASLRADLIAAGFIVVREENRRLTKDVSMKLVDSSASAADASRLVGNARLLVLARVDATNALNDFMGNRTYGSLVSWPRDNESAAARLLLLFPRMLVDPIPSNIAARDYVDTHLKAVLVKGLTAAAKTKPENAVKFLAEFLLDNNPNKPAVIPPELA